MQVLALTVTDTVMLLKVSWTSLNVLCCSSDDQKELRPPHPFV